MKFPHIYSNNIENLDSLKSTNKTKRYESQKNITKDSETKDLLFCGSFLSVAARDHIQNCIEEERKKYKNMKLQKKNFFLFVRMKKIVNVHGAEI